MYLFVRFRVRVRVWVWGRRSWEKRKEIVKRKRKKKRTKKQERRANINLFIQINKQTDKQTDRQMDGRTDRHKSFIDMRYNTEQHSKSNSIKENGDQIELIWNNLE